MLLNVDEHLGCFRVLAIVHSAVMNIWVHASFSFFKLIFIFSIIVGLQCSVNF